MHTSQTHTKPNRLRLRLTGIGLWTYHVTKHFVCSNHLLCKGRRPHHWRRGICREIHAKGTAAMLINKEEEKCPGCFLQWKVDRRFRTKLSPLALTMQGWHTGLFVRIRGRTVTSAGGFDKFTLASFWTKYGYCWVSISYWKINWIRVAENECLRGARQRLDGEKRKEEKKIPQIFHPAAHTTGPTQQAPAPAVKQDAIFPGMAFLHVNKLPYQHHLPPFDHPGKCAKCLWPPIVWFPGIRYHTAAYYRHTIRLLHTTEYFVLRRTDSNFIMTRTEWLPKESEKHDTRVFLTHA